ncbi:MAG TPA: hypothetical protein VFZ34_28235 [Blastocatellia bacterium]|nr:hypothetical protein [Blastocatellia bacterium]
MAIDQCEIIKEMDVLLNECLEIDGKTVKTGQQARLMLRIKAIIERYAPSGSPYVRDLATMNSFLPDNLWRVVSCLQALRDDYAEGKLKSVLELIHADLFSDFLEMAGHLIEQGYKDPAAVISGSVLEEHLRKLCDKHSIDEKKPDGSPKKADAMNAKLAGANVYSKLDQKNVTAWLGLRNDAAHGNYSAYTKDQVALLIQSVRDFITRNPA